MVQSMKNWLRNYIAWHTTDLYLQIICRFRVFNSKFYRLVQASRNPAYSVPNRAESTPNQKTKKPKKILFVIYWYDLGGAESYALYTAKMAYQFGHISYAISSVAGKVSERKKFDQYCAETHEISEIGAEADFRIFIADFVERKQIDILHIHHSVLMYRFLPAIKRLFPGLITIDSTHIVEYKDGGFPAFSAEYSDYIDRHNVISKNLIAVQRELYRVQKGRMLREEKFQLTYLSALFDSESVQPMKVKRKAKTITFYGRFVLQKQPNVFIATIEYLLERHPELAIEALIYGEGELQDALLARIARSKFKERFEFRGRCDDKNTVFNNTDILFLPSLNEGLSLTSYEALAYKVLTVSSDVGAQSELLCNECLVPLGASFVSDAAARLYDFLTDEEKYQTAVSKNFANFQTIQSQEADQRAIARLYNTD